MNFSSKLNILGIINTAEDPTQKHFRGTIGGIYGRLQNPWRDVDKPQTIEPPITSA